MKLRVYCQPFLIKYGLVTAVRNAEMEYREVCISSKFENTLDFSNATRTMFNLFNYCMHIPAKVILSFGSCQKITAI